MDLWLKRVFIAGLALLLLGLLGLAGLYVAGVSYGNPNRIEEQRDVQAAEISAIEILSEAADVQVEGSDGDTVKVRLSGLSGDSQGRHLDLRIVGGDTLRTSVKTQARLFLDMLLPQDGMMHSRGLKLTVSIPRKDYSKVLVRTGTGKITVKDIHPGVLELGSATGDIDVNGFRGHSIRMSTMTGNIAVDHIGSALQAVNKSGNITIGADTLPGDAAMETETGAIRFFLSNAKSPLRLELKSIAGSIRADWPGMSYVKKERREIEGTAGTGGPLLRARTATGSIEITPGDSGTAGL